MSAKRLSLFVLTLGLSMGVAQAQTAPSTTPLSPPQTGPLRRPPPFGQRPTRSAAFPLRLAYRAIGAAEGRGAGGRYLDAARTHYRSALARFGRGDQPGAASEALAAAALARASIDERPLVAPRDLPTPPPLPTPGARDGEVRRMPMAGPPLPPGGRGPVVIRRFAGRERFDAAAVAREAALANTPEANDLARSAVDADIARERAEFAGNIDEARRQGHLAHDLARAVRALARAARPQPVRPPIRRRPMSMDDGAGPPV